MHGNSVGRLLNWLSQKANGWRARLLSWRPSPRSWLSFETGLDGEGPVAIEWRKALPEWALILAVVIAFCTPFLALGSDRALPGNEAEVFQSLDWVLLNSLRLHGQFPLWDPYLQTGLPFIADPFLHVFNPLATVPVLLLGVQDGFKVALFLSFLFAALGMWLLGAVVGVGRLARLWMALMFAFTGQGVARFFQGEYDFVLGFAWIPWVLAGALATAKTGRVRWAVITAVSLALLFFSGNVYYAYYMAFVMALFMLVALVAVRREHPRLVLHWSRARWVLLASLLALGLVALQLLPLIDFWPNTVKSGDPGLLGSHSLGQILRDYLSKDPWRPDAIDALPREEFYAYIGVWPFLLLILVPAVVWQRRREGHKSWPLIFFGLLVLLAFAWIDVRAMPWAGLIARVGFFNQFRYPTRMLIYGAAGIIVLAGLGLDLLWSRVEGRRTAAKPVLRSALAPLGVRTVGLLALVVFAVWSIGDVFLTNRERTKTRDPYPVSFEIMRWLRETVPGEYYVGNNNGWHGSLLSNNLRYLDAWYGFAFHPPMQGALNSRVVRASPNYLVIGNDQAPSSPDAAVLRRFPTHTVYALPHSLPLAFAVSDPQLNDLSTGRELWADDVTSVTPVVSGPNHIEATLDGTLDSTLVVLMAAFNGWQLTVDGKAAPLRNVGGYLAAPVQPGTHNYAFRYSPVSFWVGLVISLLSVAGLAMLLVIDRRRLRAAASQRICTEAVYEEGVLKPQAALPLGEGAVVRVTVEPLPAPATVTKVEPRTAPEPKRGGARQTYLEWALFGLGLLVYLFTRLYALDRFPIYFFADEAVQSVLAQDLLDRGFKDAAGRAFPLYFEAAGNRWTPLLSVYVHAISVALAGKSIVANRATSALMSLLAAASVALILGKVFRTRHWWIGGLLMALAPAWFLHSRTGFETVMMSSFFACFLLCYLLYLTRSPRYLFAAVLFGAATFYTYSNGQMIMAAVGALLLLSDLRYHVKNWRIVLLAGALTLVLAVPLLRFGAAQPEAMTTHLRAINSYWLEQKPLSAKLEQFVVTYAKGLSPIYWFDPNQQDLVRHRMRGYGNLALPFLPFFLIGVGVCLRRIRSAPHRAVLLAALASAAGAALVGVGITRVLVFTVPATILIGLGIEALLAVLAGRVRIPYAVTAAALFVVLAGASVWMLRDALVNGPLWYSDYGLYGTQYGAKQLFQEAIPEVLATNPNDRIMMTSSWANGAETFIRFFLPKEQRSRVQMLSIDYYMDERRALDANTILVMTPAEYERARTSPKFSRVDVERMIPYPDGSPGFYFARLEYSPDFEKLLAPEREARTRPVDETFMLDGQQVVVTHSPLDAGRLADLFDGDTFTLARGLAANPLIFDFKFSQPRAIKGLAADFGSMDFQLTVSLYPSQGGEPAVYKERYYGLPPDPHVEMLFPGAPESVARMRIEIEQLTSASDVHVHVRELAFR